MRILPILLLLACCAGALAAGPGKPPPVLAIDSIAPRVVLSPPPGSYPAPVTVMFSANEHAVISASLIPGADPAVLSGGLTVINSGLTTIRYLAEDDFGNRSVLDSGLYTIDPQAPQIRLDPPPGVFAQPIVVKVKTDEPVRLLRHAHADMRDTMGWRDEFPVSTIFTGYLSAIDGAGNITTTPYLSYTVDTAQISVYPSPPPGVFNMPTAITFLPSDSMRVYWTFSSIAGPEQFNPYVAPLDCPGGAARLRWYARRGGRQSAIYEADYVVDTVAPRLKAECFPGTIVDTLVFSCREKADIRTTAGEGSFVFETATPYRQPLILPRTGRALFTAAARDGAGNISRRVVFEKRYDTIPPVLRPSHPSGMYNHLFLLSFSSSEPVKIYYTLDGSLPSKKSILYGGVIPISAQGRSAVRYIAYDDAGNASPEGSLELYLDHTPPKVKARIEGDPGLNEFRVSLSADEDAEIRYAIGNGVLDGSSPLYKEPIAVRAGQILRYFATDKAGNATAELTLRELTEPIAAVEPDGGTFRNPVSLRFKASLSAAVYARILPDTVFREIKDSLTIAEDGDYVVEYYALAEDGGRMPVRRSVFRMDMTAPRVKVSVRKGSGDSVSVFFESSENADIIYTLDGTDPGSSRTMRIAGNKLALSRDRITVRRNENARLALFAEDAAGNRSTMTLLDIFRPTVVPGVPAGTSRIYDRILSVTLNTFDERSQIRYERHGRMPTPYSPLYTGPVTLTRSDTIKAFVIDASGFKGSIETLVYLIDLPPRPAFTMRPDTGVAGVPVAFDASMSHDDESPNRDLTFAWDFDGDGRADQTVKSISSALYTFPRAGVYTVRLTLTDSRSRSTTIERPIAIRGSCPAGMISVPRDSGRSFCIDRVPTPAPDSGSTWIDAYMACRDAGRRLCSADEWSYACAGADGAAYPYGSAFDARLCTGLADAPRPCLSIFGARDMIGVAAEWVADQKKGRASAMGGSAQNGPEARCSASLTKGIVDPAPETGYRCCR